MQLHDKKFGFMITVHWVLVKRVPVAGNLLHCLLAVKTPELLAHVGGRFHLQSLWGIRSQVYRGSQPHAGLGIFEADASIHGPRPQGNEKRSCF